ncbi:MAG: oligosaccharide flippase family protein [Anaerolineae bacterium]
MTRLSRHTLILTANNVGSAGLSFALSVLIGRALGTEGLGVYAAVLAWMFPLGLIAEFGVSTLLTREVAQNHALAEDYLRAALRTYVLMGSLCALLLWLLAPLLVSDRAVVDGLRLSAPLLLVAPSFGAFTALFRAQGDMLPIPLLNIGMWLAQFALTLLVFLLGMGITAALVINVATSAVQLAAAWWVYRRRFRAAAAGLALPLLPLLKRALPFAVGAALVALQARASTIMLERLSDTAQTGYYAAANRFIEAGRMLPNAFFGALFPTLAALAMQPLVMRRTFRRALLTLGAFGTAFGVGVLLAAPLLIGLYGEQFGASVGVLQLLAWVLLPALLRAALTLYAYARGRETLANIVTGVMLALQIALGLWAIPTYGALGAAGVTLAVETLGCAALAALLLRSGQPSES